MFAHGPAPCWGDAGSNEPPSQPKKDHDPSNNVVSGLGVMNHHVTTRTGVISSKSTVFHSKTTTSRDHKESKSTGTYCAVKQRGPTTQPEKSARESRGVVGG